MADVDEKKRILDALACASKAELTQRSLEFALSEDVRAQDTTLFLRRLAQGQGLTSGLALKETWGYIRRCACVLVNEYAHSLKPF